LTRVRTHDPLIAAALSDRFAASAALLREHAPRLMLELVVHADDLAVSLGFKLVPLPSGPTTWWW
jgi:hypothetical protein